MMASSIKPVLPTSYKAAVIEAPGAPLKVIDVDLKKPGPGQVLVKVLACGVCHSDAGLQQGHFGPHLFPRVPGHEIVGDVVEIGEGVSRVANGDRVGGTWHGGHDHTCRQCHMGLFQICDNAVSNGISQDGGYAEFVLLRSEAVVRVPKDLDPAQVGPLLCAGVTVFNSIRKMKIEQGNLVAIQGIGGLGHLAIQYANKMGYKVAALSSGPEKRDLALKLGAHEFIDSSQVDPIEALKELGGAALIIATAPNPKSIAPLTGALRAAGKLCVLSPVGQLEINSFDLISKAASVHGWPSGHALDCEDAIDFARTHGVTCLVERFSLHNAQEAMDTMIQNKVRFRSVLVMGSE
ncbi:alcohol dehydrogenase GroES-like domain-containing protein [Ilyonectria robusta]|uniref:alcohol dehydrogenase GroES-like domain-containing protein n=1 Tax=Ilyonectria robusta TaxID=1079257 RepID=UPI001E8E459A|nr:alcohol dehydrogenase GroES-like domain-containing protein [Ilyonectria robusta]KAH8721606.1 alcohol dehydrogenase GroES-like domain-containing protein [Ilyonectria robusta]